MYVNDPQNVHLMLTNSVLSTEFYFDSCVAQVESFEEGDLISNYVNDPQNVHNEALADIGLESYLKMLLFDRFFHADLHPGNILVRFVAAALRLTS